MKGSRAMQPQPEGVACWLVHKDPSQNVALWRLGSSTTPCRVLLLHYWTFSQNIECVHLAIRCSYGNVFLRSKLLKKP